METVDDTESGNLCYKGRNQHSQEKQSHDELFAAEFKSFDDKCGNGSQHYIKYQGNRQYYYSIFKADQQIFIGKYFFIIFKSQVTSGRGQQRGRQCHGALGL